MMNGGVNISDKSAENCKASVGKERPWVLMPGGLSFMLPAINAAHDCGLNVATLDYIPDNPAHKESDCYINADVTDYDAVKKAAETLDVAGILAFAVDPAVETAAKVAEALGLPFAASAEAAAILQNKDRFRHFLSVNGFNVPRSMTLYGDSGNIPEMISLIKKLEYMPLIIKPVDSAGSKGVTKVYESSQIEGALRNALAYSRRKTVIVEEFVEACGYPSDCEVFLEGGRVAYLSFSSQWFDAGAPNPYVPAAFTWPALFTKEQRDEAGEALQRLSDLLELRTGIFNVEMRFSPEGRLYLMEVSPRAGGNRLAEMMERIDGVPLIENAVRGAVGMSLKPFIKEVSDEAEYAIQDKMPDSPDRHNEGKGYYAEIIIHARESGRFRCLKVDESIAGYVEEIRVSVSDGDEISEFTGADRMIGMAILSFPDEDVMHEVVREIVVENKHISVKMY